MPAPTTVYAFLECGYRSGLLEHAAVETLQTHLNGHAPTTPRALADALIEHGLLTNFQAEKLLNGRWRGFVIAGKYRLLERLGAGGMGAVYLAVDTRLDRKLALKVMLPEFAADRDAKERFLREARAAAKITHDNVVIVHEADEREGVPYIAMQFLQGYPLDEFLKQKGTPALPHVIRIARETALGLAAAHELGLVHRDIKPANLWLEAPNGRVKVLDFGLAKPVGTDAELTKSGAVVGTPAYMSPEQARGQKVDSRTDLFSLGSVLYRLCTGQTPFAGPNVMAVLMALGHDEPTPVRELNPNVPEPLAQLIHQLLAKKPEDRPQTATEVAKRLRAILEQRLAPSAPSAESPVPKTSSADVSNSLRGHLHGHDDRRLNRQRVDHDRQRVGNVR
jgi:serine/threonine protein kinase